MGVVDDTYREVGRMTTMAAGWSALDRASDLIGLTCEELAHERDRAAAEVDSLLERWRGEAADRYRAGWREWSEEAGTVIAVLAALGEAIDGVRRTFRLTDEDVAASGARLQARLGAGS